MRKPEPAFLNGREDETFGRQKSFVRVEEFLHSFPNSVERRREFYKYFEAKRAQT